MKICVLIPAYNEGERIEGVVSKILKLEEVSEVVVVDDGSADSTSEKAKKGGAIVLRHRINKGKGAALRTGFSYVKNKDFDAVITMDGDGQHKYSEIPNFIKEFKEKDSGIVLGTRMGKCRNMPFIRYATNRFTSFVTSLLCGSKITDSQSGFRLISVKALKKIKLSTSKFEIESEVLIQTARKGFKFIEIPISTVYLPDSTQKSKINPFIDTLRFFRFVIENVIRKN